MIDSFARDVPKELYPVSGSVFYSGRAAFSKQSLLYLLGLNPGGSPKIQANETIEWHTRQVLEEMPIEWSAYSDESWKGAEPGTHGLQPRVLHVLNSLGFNPRLVPASNVVFVRTERESMLGGDFGKLAEVCWPFHQSVISELGIKVILCFGQKAGNWVAKNMSANRKIGEFSEKNNRGWKSKAFSNEQGLVVVSATHPSIADWSAPPTDPTPLVQQALAYAS